MGIEPDVDHVRYPEVKRVGLVPDPLDTQARTSPNAAFPPAEAKRPADRMSTPIGRMSRFFQEIDRKLGGTERPDLTKVLEQGHAHPNEEPRTAVVDRFR